MGELADDHAYGEEEERAGGAAVQRSGQDLPGGVAEEVREAPYYYAVKPGRQKSEVLGPIAA